MKRLFVDVSVCLSGCPPIRLFVCLCVCPFDGSRRLLVGSPCQQPWNAVCALGVLLLKLEMHSQHLVD